MKTVIKYGSKTCGPCIVYGPKFQDVADRTDGVNFISIDTASGDPRILEHGIRNIPTTVVLDSKGKVLKKKSGVMSPDQLKEFIK